MLENLNTKFWFWATLAFINIVVISIVMKTDDKFTCTLASCMLFFSLIKALKYANEIEENEG
ncbi:MAG TPA: hypothetical protein DCM10_01840 [Xanthomarina gelatinilytica]|nr:hypothetical protein [Xanthomarina gelatinilytica]|tara:strand:+ start:311 stop:496 length:186 start_codon:yes stop_codon:yes gene_type:complete